MFRSYREVRSDQFGYRVVVNDDDFIDDSDWSGEERYWVLTSFAQPITPAGRIMASVVFPIIRVIEVYKGRGLPVAGNVVKAIQYAEANSWAYRECAQNIMTINAKYNKQYAEYAEAVEQYAMLL